jgi:hypothetical protein
MRSSTRALRRIGERLLEQIRLEAQREQQQLNAQQNSSESAAPLQRDA